MSTHGKNDGSQLGRGASIGRYFVVGLLGRGGMGEVYAAYDPELDRKVALKLLRHHATAGVNPSEGRARLLREAQAIARLSDPNVVVVFDVGMFGDRVFLAMEFIDGNTLGYWLAAGTRTWREVVTLFTAAGRGLASAHKAGLVHRDFKPDNVMIGRDGQVHVMDFGLARSIEPEPASTPASTAASAASTAASAVLIPPPTPGSETGPPSAPAVGGHPSTVALVGAAPHIGNSPDLTTTRNLAVDPIGIRTDYPAALPSPLHSSLTVTGALVGTPAYMAPEQFRSGTIDARTDQFSFCAALYQGLYGEPPFAGNTIHELSANVIAGRVREPRSGARVPGWLRKVVLRGLRVEQAERHPSMEALLAKLHRDPARTGRWWAAAASIVGLIAVLATGLVRAERRQRLQCLDGDAKLEGIWELPGGRGPSARKEAIRRAFLATGKRHAADSFAVMATALDRYASDWKTMHREACEATSFRGEQSADVLDLRMSCLQDRLSEVRALTAVFGDANGEVVTRALEAAQALKPVAQCADIVALRAVVKPPDDPTVRRAVADVRAHLAELKALANAGRYKRALEQILEITEEARRANYQPVIAEALLQLASLQELNGELRGAEKSYEEALWRGEASRHDEVSVEAADQLIQIVGYRQGRQAEGERWAQLADAILQRLGPGHELLAAWRANNLGMVYRSAGRLEEALGLCQAALAMKKKAVGEGHYDVAVSMTTVASLLHQLGRTDEAIRENQHALEILRRALGPDHPRLAPALTNAAEFMNATGRYAEAQAMAEQALAISERELSPGHPALAAPLAALGWSWIQRSKPDLAIGPLERALWIREARDPSPALLGETRFGLARALWDSNRGPERALSIAAQARNDYQKSPGTLKQKVLVEGWIEARRAQRLSMR